ncbi:MAG: hypothetical protein JOZ52_14445, partial [Acidobacteria bacterium]|nr:hypothetical protein [Acidobacteriota bacterium]
MMVKSERTSFAAPVMQSGSRATLRRTLLILGALSLSLICVALLASLIGSERLPVASSLCAIFSGGRGLCALTEQQRDILFEIRIP